MLKQNKFIFAGMAIILTIAFFLLRNKSVVGENLNQTAATNESYKKEDARADKKEVMEMQPTSTTGAVVYHANYALSYHEKYEQAEWVFYELKANNVSNINFQRPFFIYDPKVKTQSADYKNYKNSGYDRGHLCPAGDMKFSKEAFDDTFSQTVHSRASYLDDHILFNSKFVSLISHDDEGVTTLDLSKLNTIEKVS